MTANPMTANPVHVSPVHVSPVQDGLVKVVAPGQLGAVALLVALVGAGLSGAGLVLAVAATDLATTSGRAGIAADAAALAAVAASPVAGGDGRPCAAAQALAAANGARLRRCLAGVRDGWPLRAEVTVEATPSSPWLRRLAPSVAGRSAAVLDPPLAAVPRHLSPAPTTARSGR
jgi:hypothetical protein